MNSIVKSTRRQFIKISSVTAGFLLLGFNFTKNVYAEVKDAIAERLRSVYDHEASMKYRKSQDNPEVKKIYKDFLEHPVSHKSHELLHTKYVDRSARIKALAKQGIKVELRSTK